MEVTVCDFGDQIIKGTSPPCSLRLLTLGKVNCHIVRTLVASRAAV